MSGRSDKDAKFITRFDYERSHGWYVRVERRNSYVRKFFSDSVHGGKGAALKAAEAFRDALEIAPRVKVGHGRGRVFRQIRTYLDAGGNRREYDTWSAWIRIAGKPQTVSFNILKHGPEESLRLANKWLRAKRKEQKAIACG